jgi:aspartokinase
MLSIPKAVQSAIETDGFLHFGLANGVLNLSKTARFMKPLVEARTKKSVSVSAITMALSRLKIGKRQANTRFKTVKLEAIRVTKNLAELTYDKTAENTRALEKAEASTRRSGIFIVATIGTREITVITEAESVPVLRKMFPSPPKAHVPDIVAVGVEFDEKYVPQIGMFYTLIQQLTFQNINIIEFSSTYTELIFYLHKKDLKLAFDTLYDQFM